jgi:hypothetical protein
MGVPVLEMVGNTVEIAMIYIHDIHTYMMANPNS